MPKIIPLRELKNASKVSQLAHEYNEPIFVTKNGESDLVILSSDKYDELNNNNYVIRTDNNIIKEPDVFQRYLNYQENKAIYSIAEIKQILSPIFKKHKVNKAILFGSYVKGTADSRSDVDLVVDTDLQGFAYYELLEDVNDALTLPVDFIAKEEILKDSDFAKEVEATGVTIYG